MALGIWLVVVPQPGRAIDSAPNDLTSSRRWDSESGHPLELDNSDVQREPTGDLHPLDAREIACLAACRWHPAIGLRQRARTIQDLFRNEPPSTERASGALVCFLQLQAAYQEDVGAASAMRAYYSRIGIAEQQHWIDSGFHSIELQLKKQSNLIDQGLAAGLDLSSLDRRKLDLQDQRLQTLSQQRQLRDLLASLTGLRDDLAERTVEPLTIQATKLDCDLVVGQAMCERTDLLAWQYLCSQLEDSNAPMIATVLSSLSGSFGLPVPTCSVVKRLLCQGVDPKELTNSLRRELSVLIQTHQAYIEQSVREKCEQLILAYERHEIEQQRIESWLNRLTQLERLEFHGQTMPDQRMAAQAGLLESRSTEVTRRLEAKLAEVALAEAVGGLALRCCRGEAWLPTGM